MQTASSSVWTQVIDSISNDDNGNTKRAFLCCCKDRIETPCYQNISTFQSLCWLVGCRTHQLHLCRGVRHPPSNVQWLSRLVGCRTHRLHLCREFRHLSLGVLNMILNNLKVRLQYCSSFGKCEYSIAIAPRSTLAWNGRAWKSPFYGSTRTFWHLNWKQRNDLC